MGFKTISKNIEEEKSQMTVIREKWIYKLLLCMI
jgi:hypothetical protein